MWGFMSITTNTQARFNGENGMKLKDKKIELLKQVTEHDSEDFSTTTLHPVCPPVWAYFRQGSIRRSDHQLQGRSAVHNQL